jgi:serine/threonine protein kinase
MTPERYERLCELFDQTQALGPSERAAFLDVVGAADPSIRTDLERMLAGDQQARGEQLLQEPCPINARAFFSPGELTARTLGSAAPEPEDNLVGAKVGPYRIEQRIGHGGMGTVYQARREEGYRQRVALKVIRPGLDSAELLGRFHTERQVLAELEHPHIARLLDGGTLDDGRPYFVMEYIDGEPLDRFCEQRQLSTSDRLRLLQGVCAAVQHAHQRGILHRDLKPANVLVAADGTPRVTDFGLARKLDETGQTASGAILGTPSYMAPEQAGGKRAALGPVTDVYALGAILYELLTGRPPFRAETPLETLLQVLEEEPMAPGRLHPKLPRDLETIGLARLCRRHRKRYAAAARFYARAFADTPHLADDLRAGDRYQAACAAALAASGQGIDAGTLTQQERASLRRQALSWLRADLGLWARNLEGNPPATVQSMLGRLLAKQGKGEPPTRTTVQTMLEQWQRDPDLASLRGEASLAGLPPEEALAWLRFWADVASLRKRSLAGSR